MLDSGTIRARRKVLGAAIALLGACGESATTEDSVIHSRQALVGAVELTVQPGSYLGFVCVWQPTLSFDQNCTQYADKVYDLAAGTYALDLPYTTDQTVPGSGAGTVTVAADGTVTLGGIAGRIFDTPVQGSGARSASLRLKTTPLTIDRRGYVGMLGVYIAGWFDTPTLQLVPERRYSLVSGWSFSLRGFGGFFSDTWDLTIHSDGHATVDTESARAAFSVTAPATLVAKTETFTWDPGQYPGTDTGLQGVLWMHSPPLVLLRGRKYVLMVYWSEHIPEAGETEAPHLLLDENGILGLNAAGQTSFEVVGSTLRTRTAPVTLDPAGYTGGDIGVYSVSTFHTPTLHLLRGRRYQLFTHYSTNPVRLDGLFTTPRDVNLSGAGRLTIGPETGQYFSVDSNQNLLTARVAQVTIERNGHTGTLCIYPNFPGCAFGSEPLRTLLIIGRTYSVGSVSGPKFTVGLDGSVTPPTVSYEGSTLAIRASDPSGAPASPLNLAATAVSASQVDLTWTYVSGNQNGIRGERSDDGGATWVPVAGCDLGPFTTRCSDLSNLPRDRIYRYRVYAYNLGTRSYSGEVPLDLRAGAAPAGLVASIRAGGIIDLTWTDNTPNETSFRIERSTAPTSGFVEIGTAGANQPIYSDSVGLVQGTEYHYRVRSRGSAGDSGYSNTASANFSAPAKPAGVMARLATNTRVELTWADVASETSYQVMRSTNDVDFAPIATVATNVLVYNDTPIVPNATNYYRIVARNVVGDSPPSDSVSASTLLPGAPLNLKAVVSAADQINLTWTNGSGTRTNNRVERSTDEFRNNLSVVATLGPNSTSRNDSGRAANTTYWYRVISVNSFGDSASSNVVVSRTSVPAPPTDFKATVVSASRIDLSWTDTINETSYLVQRKVNNGTFTTVGANPMAQNTTSFSNTGLSSSNTYTYQIRSQNTEGNSAWVVLPVIRTNAPVPPTGLVATPVSGSSIALTWNDPSNNENGFYVERSLDSAFTNLLSTTFTVAQGVRTFTDTGLPPSTRFYYRVRSFNGVDMSANSPTVEATTRSQCDGDANGTACNDGNLCTAGDVCGMGACAGSAVACPTNTACSSYACRPSDGQCVPTHQPVQAACSDGDACTTDDFCNGEGACISTQRVQCEGGTECSPFACNPASGQCQQVLATSGTPCFDGNSCTDFDTCNGSGQCQAGSPRSCDDQDSCTADSCTAGNGCQHLAVCSPTSSSPMSSIAVRVVDAVGAPRPKVSVFPVAGGVAAAPAQLTNADGYAYFALPFGQFHFEASADGTRRSSSELDDCIPGYCDQASIILPLVSQIAACGTDDFCTQVLGAGRSIHVVATGRNGFGLYHAIRDSKTFDFISPFLDMLPLTGRPWLRPMHNSVILDVAAQSSRNRLVVMVVVATTPQTTICGVDGCSPVFHTSTEYSLWWTERTPSAWSPFRAVTFPQNIAFKAISLTGTGKEAMTFCGASIDGGLWVAEAVWPTQFFAPLYDVKDISLSNIGPVTRVACQREIDDMQGRALPLTVAALAQGRLWVTHMTKDRGGVIRGLKRDGAPVVGPDNQMGFVDLTNQLDLPPDLNSLAFGGIDRVGQRHLVVANASSRVHIIDSTAFEWQNLGLIGPVLNDGETLGDSAISSGAGHLQLFDVTSTGRVLMDTRLSVSEAWSIGELSSADANGVAGFGQIAVAEELLSARTPIARVEVTPTHLRFTWPDSEEYEREYRIYLDGKLNVTLPALGPGQHGEYLLDRNSLDPGRRYGLEMVAVGPSGGDWQYTSPSFHTTLAQPTPPRLEYAQEAEPGCSFPCWGRYNRVHKLVFNMRTTGNYSLNLGGTAGMRIHAIKPATNESWESPVLDRPEYRMEQVGANEFANVFGCTFEGWEFYTTVIDHIQTKVNTSERTYLRSPIQGKPLECSAGPSSSPVFVDPWDDFPDQPPPPPPLCCSKYPGEPM